MFYFKLLIFVAVSCLSSSAKLPSDFKKCSLKDPDFKKCFAAAIEVALKKLENPPPELGLPSLDPLNITKHMSFLDSHKTAWSLNEDVDFLGVSGMAKGKVENADINFDQKTLQFLLLMNVMTMNVVAKFIGDFNAVDSFNFKGHGFGSHNNTSFGFNATFEEFTKQNEKYIRIVDCQVEWKVTDSMFVIDKSDNKEAADRFNGILKEHFREAFQGSGHDYEQILAGGFMGYTNLFLSQIPLNELFE